MLRFRSTSCIFDVTSIRVLCLCHFSWHCHLISKNVTRFFFAYELTIKYYPLNRQIIISKLTFSLTVIHDTHEYHNKDVWITSAVHFRVDNWEIFLATVDSSTADEPSNDESTILMESKVDLG
ncbi:hypothetical protein L2E82_12770 [Cichorium intybus]|uniref:Uncharacterized protein n=1 Tax=Cichorium intybus TaxID=13427 RepID=A0ACB9GI25_CICIN|nr:hypothetical protein L2E82_12770 [Cichorium intybus]